MSTFYFAWVDPSETGFGSEHHVFDENVFSWELQHSEGEFAQLTIDVLNPGTGLLNSGRKQWAWFAVVKPDTTVVPVFFGRLIGIPQELTNEVVRLVFIARPTDFEDQKVALAETLKVAPYWDPMWISDDKLNDPDTVLEARPELWHIDRTTLAVTTSNLINGEDGTLDLAGGYFYDSLSVSYDSPAAKKCQVEATINWTQRATGLIDVASRFPSTIYTMSPEGLFNDWPTGGQSIGQFWVVENSQASVNVFPTWTRFSFLTQDGLEGLFNKVGIHCDFFNVRYKFERGYTEKVSFTLQADIQALLTEPGEEEIEKISVSANADQPVPAGTGFEAPNNSPFSRRFIQTTRGLQALQFLITMARARLLLRARAITVSLETSLETGLDLSCRQNVQITDTRLPGDTVIGKVKSYSLSFDGDKGEGSCKMALGCTIGNASEVEVLAGSATYVEDGYVNAGYVYRTLETFAVLADEVTYEDFSAIQPNDDGLDPQTLTPASAVVAVRVFNVADEQIDALDEDAEEVAPGPNMLSLPNTIDAWDVAEKINTNHTEIELEMVDFERGPFETEFPITVSVLAVPKTIDLEAA